MPVYTSIDELVQSDLPSSKEVEQSPSTPEVSNQEPRPRALINDAQSNSEGPQNYKERNAFQISPPIDATYEALTNIKTSIQFLAIFDPSVRQQLFTLHPWQIDINEDFSLGRTRDKLDPNIILKSEIPTSIHPYKYALCAANGSGKDAFVIAPFALWFICTKIKAKVIITSASGTQLTTQTESYIAALAREVNNWSKSIFGYEMLKVNKRHVYCKRSGSVIHMFATDEGEKAEGHHPTAPGCEMAIIVNEAKSIKPEIFLALRRCTGYNYLLFISSPGEPFGDFYDAFENWQNRRRISYFDCPHHSPDEFEEERIKYGEHHPWFRSKWLALFTAIGGTYVITKENLIKVRKKARQNSIPWLNKSAPISIGIDIGLSEHGDETVMSVWQGNKQLAQYTYREQDSVNLAHLLKHDLLKHVTLDHKYIFADDGGVGRSVIDIMRNLGVKRINRVLNNSVDNINRKAFRNKGAATWFKVNRLFELEAIIPLDDDTLYRQLESRKYKKSDAGLSKLTLEPKSEMRKAGISSPDRADAMVLAFTHCDIKQYISAKSQDSAPRPTKETRDQQYNRLKFELTGRKPYIYLQNTKPKDRRVFYSQHVALRNN